MGAGAFKKIFSGDSLAIAGVIGVATLLLLAIFAPFLACGQPFYAVIDGEVRLPFWRGFFAPETTETITEKFWNYLSLILIPATLLLLLARKWRKFSLTLLIILDVATAIPFFCVQRKMERVNYRAVSERVIFAPIPYGPNEISGTGYEAPSRRHICGTDGTGRDVAARLLYGARISLTVGIFVTLFSSLIGVSVGMISGYFGGWFDLLTMRVVEILMCFPTFLLLLILMSLMGDCGVEQSIPLLIGVMTFSGWTGLALLVRGETLKQKSLPYISACVVSGVPTYRILFRQILPNITGPIAISFTFGIAGAISAEAGLSFLGFGVRQPTASWGGLLREAFNNPLDYWHLTFFPGLVLFITILSINFVGGKLSGK